MRDHFGVKLVRFMLAVVMLMAWSVPSFAQESAVVLTLRPVQTAFVKGDVSKFRAINWTKDGAQSGIKALLLDVKPTKDVTVSFEGSGMVGDADYTGGMLVTKENLGYVKFNYDSFRKYYDNKGGYYPFPSAGMALQTLTQDLKLDVGHFAVEIGKGTASDPDFSVGYERATKNGIKDSTTWGYVKDYAYNANATVNRKKIAPIFITKDEITDTLTVKGKVDVAGFKVKGEQKYVFFKGNNLREERVYGSAGATTAENKITRQTETPQTKELSSVIRAERWSLNDKTYVAMGYRFGHVRNSMLYVSRDYNSATGLLLWSAGNFKDGYAQNIQDTHTVTGMMSSNLTDQLTLISRVKGELKSSYGTSHQYFLNSAEVGTTDLYQVNEDKVTNSAESFSLRYAGIARTSLYADLELSQERNWKALNYPTSWSTSAPNPALLLSETINHVPETVGTLGMRVTPVDKVSLTTELKYKEKIDKLDKVTGSAATYINKLNTVSEEVSTRLAWKPFKWLENSFKVKAVDNLYRIQAMNFNKVKMPGTERDFIYGINLMPTDQVMVNLSYALQLSKTGGIGDQSVYAPPPYTANVYTWALSSSYAPTEKFIFFDSLEYSRAKNQTNVDGKSITTTLASMGPMLMGLDQEWYSIDNGVKWLPTKSLTIEPHYAYYAFRNFEGVSTGNYSAHVIWLDVNVTW